MVDSELDQYPKAEIDQIDNIVDVKGGGTPSKEKKEFWENPSIAWFTPTDLTKSSSMFKDGSSLMINELGLSKSSATLFPSGSVMMTSRATIGEISITTVPATTNQGFITCIPSKGIPSSFIYFWLQERVEWFKKIANGTTFLELPKKTFRVTPVIVPPSQVLSNFSDVMKPICDLVYNLSKQNRHLIQERDLLLPRLISGELDVSDLDLVA